MWEAGQKKALITLTKCISDGDEKYSLWAICTPVLIFPMLVDKVVGITFLNCSLNVRLRLILIGNGYQTLSLSQS